MEYWESPEALAAFSLKDYVAGTKDNTFLLDALTSVDEQKETYSGNG
jgi:hypothetical protein